MKNLIVLTALITLFSLSGLIASAQASPGTSVYGTLNTDLQEAPVFISLEDDSFGESVPVSAQSAKAASSIDAQFNCSEGLFTLTHGQGSSDHFEIIDVVCEELPEY